MSDGGNGNGNSNGNGNGSGMHGGGVGSPGSSPAASPSPSRDGTLTQSSLALLDLRALDSLAGVFSHVESYDAWARFSR
jgi:hypothetical protein